MPIPKSRLELINLVKKEYQKLQNKLEWVDAKLANQICVDDWSIKDLLAVRLWWTENVLNWIDQGKQGGQPDLPAKGYSWKQTPRLNNEIVTRSRKRAYKNIVRDLDTQYHRLLKTIDDLNDDELLATGHFQWAGNYPLCRWLSINTARQYHTASTYIHRVIRTK